MNGLHQEYNRQELINLMADAKGLVIHNDMDGLYSGLYMSNKYNIPIVGVIELGSDDDDLGYFTLNENFNTPNLWNDVVFLDCGIVDSRAKVIDHHLSPPEYYNNRKINYHKNFSKSKNIWDKCPLNNIMWIMAIHKEDGSNFTPFQQALLASADGTHICYHNPQYKENVLYALDILNLNNFIPILDKMGNRRFHEGDDFLGMSFPFFYTLNDFKSQSGATLEEIGNKVIELFNWNSSFMVNSSERYSLSTYFVKEGSLKSEDIFTYTSIRHNQYRITKIKK